MKNKVRIIAGQWRGSKLTFPDTFSLRPTPDRVRETVFNWLNPDIVGSQCLDLFAGSGALGFEAASRKASGVLLVERDRAAVAAIRANIDRLRAHQRVEVWESAVQDFLKKPVGTFDVAFLDPPYGQGLVSSNCWALERNGWLKDHAKIYVETEISESLFSLPPRWHLLKKKQAGAVRYYLFERRPD